MIPSTARDLDDLLAEIERQHHEVGDLFEETSMEAATWSPDPSRWSMTAHVAHLDIVNKAYLEALAEAIRAARAGDDVDSDGREVGASASGGPAPESLESSGRSEEPYRHPWLAEWFVRSLEPPPKPRLSTFRSMVPEPEPDPEETVADFQLNQNELAALIEEARGLDLGEVRFGSPFFRLLRLSVGTGFEAVLAHNRRHLWLIRELMDHEEFPGDAPT